MENTYSWRINQLETAPQLNSLTNVVVAVHYTRVISRGNYQTEYNGFMGCGKPSEIDFTVYPDLTQQQIESWLDAGVDVASIDETLQVQLEQIINPPVVVLPLPWN